MHHCTQSQHSKQPTSKGAALRLCWQLVEHSCTGAALGVLLGVHGRLVALSLRVCHGRQGLAGEGVLGGLAGGAGVGLVVIVLCGWRSRQRCSEQCGGMQVTGGEGDRSAVLQHLSTLKRRTTRPLGRTAGSSCGLRGPAAAAMPLMPVLCRAASFGAVGCVVCCMGALRAYLLLV